MLRKSKEKVDIFIILLYNKSTVRYNLCNLIAPWNNVI